MPSPVFEIIKNAVASKQQMQFIYGGHLRIVCPHVVGFGKSGSEKVLIYQFAGESSKGLPPNGEWRCFEVSQIKDASTNPGTWYSGPSHLRPQTCVSRIVIEVDY